MSSESTRKPTPVSEEALIVSAKNGDDYAFAALAEIYKRVLEYQINNTNTPPSMKEDLFQDGLIGLFKAVKTYNGTSASFSTYATHCIRNSIISGIRKYSAQCKNSFPTDVIEDETVPSAEEMHLDDVRAKVLYDNVFSALSPYEKLVFDMYLSDMSYEDIAFVTGKNVKSASNAVYRIRTKLKQIVNQTNNLPND